jgi:uncharacterized protein involved in outer membrane biogenesis
MAGRKTRGAAIAFGVFVLALVVLIAVWNWNWFDGLVEARASTALGRKVEIARLGLRLGNTTTVTLNGIVAHQPTGFPNQPDFARIRRLTVSFRLWPLLLHGRLILPQVDIDTPALDIRALPDGKANWRLPASKPGTTQSSSAAPEVQSLTIENGTAGVDIPQVKARFDVHLATTPQDDRLAATADGTYAAQPITARMAGGALLSLRENGVHYPITLTVANGDTHLSLKGTIDDPLHFAGAQLSVHLSGQTMSALYPLTGIPIPQTPPYRLDGTLDDTPGHVTLHDFAAMVGRTDLSGTLAISIPHAGDKPDLTADLRSRSVDLNDLAGFIGGAPGEKTTPDLDRAQKAQLARAADSNRLLPGTPFDLPRLNAINAQLRYHADHIQGKYVPFDRLDVGLDLANGTIALHPLNLAIGRGTLASTIDLAEHGGMLHAKARAEFDQVDLARIMQATHSFAGAGTIGGGAYLTTEGNSLSAMLGNGNGALTINMAGGGNLSALLLNLSGLEIGNAILSALKIPSKAEIQCLRSHFTLRDGVMTTDILALDTTQDIIRGRGAIDFRTEKIDYQLQTHPTHFSIGTIYAPINIGGTLKHPAVAPGYKALAERGGVMAALAIAFPPLAVIPTIQLGVGEGGDCKRLAAGG